MRRLALADLLVDFGKPPERITPAAAAHEPEATPPPAPPRTPPEPVPDIAGMIADAVSEARRELAEHMEQDFAARLAKERDGHAAEIKALDARHGDAAGRAIAERLAALEERLVDMTSAVVARILGPVLSADLQRKSVQSLAAIVREALGDGGALRVRVRGPLSLFEAFEAAVGDHAGRVEFTETGTLDLEVAIDESLYETRLSDWSSHLAEAVR